MLSNNYPSPKQTNEMLQHLGNIANEVLWQFISACLRLNQIPNAWRKASIYPIPKPKPWECKLNNTRPITLLDTTRKASPSSEESFGENFCR